MTDETIRLSVVTPVYQAAGCIEAFCTRMVAVAEAFTPDYELLLVEDGSSDDSWIIIKRLEKENPRIRVITHGENRGQIAALFTGLSQARGALVFTIDDDLEEQPEWLALFYEALLRDKVEIMFGTQAQRHDKWFKFITGWMTFFVMNRLCKLGVVGNVVTARLLTRKAVDTIVAAGQDTIPYCLMCYRTGLEYSAVTVQKQSLKRSSYSVWRRICFAARYFACYYSLRRR